MSAEEIAQYKALPDNMPETKLTAKQAQLVVYLYYTYIENNIDNSDWTEPLYKTEKKEGWLGSQTMKEVEAKRIVLNWLTEQQGRKLEVKRLLSLLSCRPTFLRFLSKALEVKE